jgi:endonuclease V-like protein UPF0215 family
MKPSDTTIVSVASVSIASPLSKRQRNAVARTTFSHVIGIDDAPFPRRHRGDVLVVGAVFAGLRLEGVLTGHVRRDGANATRVLEQLVADSKFAAQLQLLLLQGIALAGFNVVDVHALHAALGVPVLAVARRRPDRDAIKRALLSRVPGGRRKWSLIERLDPMEPVAGVWIQRVGLTAVQAKRVVQRLAVNGSIPEPLRVAHLVAGALATGQSRGRT